MITAAFPFVSVVMAAIPLVGMIIAMITAMITLSAFDRWSHKP